MSCEGRGGDGGAFRRRKQPRRRRRGQQRRVEVDWTPTPDAGQGGGIGRQTWGRVVWSPKVGGGGEMGLGCGVSVIYYANLVSGPTKNRARFLGAKSSHGVRTRSAQRPWLRFWKLRIGQEASRWATSRRKIIPVGF